MRWRDRLMGSLRIAEALSRRQLNPGISKDRLHNRKRFDKIIAVAAAAPMANMQNSWMENSVKRTLTTALVWRSAT